MRRNDNGERFEDRDIALDFDVKERQVIVVMGVGKCTNRHTDVGAGGKSRWAMRDSWGNKPRHGVVSGHARV